MGSAGEPERKRRHFSSISSTDGAAAKNHLLSPYPDDKKVDVAVLQFQNQKLFQQLEAQKIECVVLDEKYNKLKEQHQVFEDATIIVNKCWDQLTNDLELRSISTSESSIAQHYLQNTSMVEDGASFPVEDDFLGRLLETVSTECCSYNGVDDSEEDCTRIPNGTTKVILQNIINSINSIWHVSDGVTSELQATLLEDDPDFQLQNSVDELKIKIRRLITTLNDLHVKHRLISSRILNYRDMDAKFKAEQRRLTGVLASTVIELEDGNSKLAILKAQGDGSKGAPIIFPILGNKSIGRDVARDTPQEIHEMESSHKELQNTLVDVKTISYSRAFMVLKGTLDKARAGLDNFRISLEKLQVEKENFIWFEKEVTVKGGLADVYKKISDLSKSHIAEFEQELHKFIQERYLLETKLEEASKGPGRKEIIAEFQELVSSIPKEIGLVENELSKLKETASEIHCLRAQMQSLSGILARSRDVLESRDMEYKAWAHVHCLKSSLDEYCLEARVKTAIEAHATSQRRLATTEADVADLRQNLELSVRAVSISSETLKSKHEESEGYLSEIESIGQAYRNMQAQNQHLLQQVTERDACNIKVILQLKIREDQVTKLIEGGWQIFVALGNAQRRLADVQIKSQELRHCMNETQIQLMKSRFEATELLIELERERFNKKRIDEGIETMTIKATTQQLQTDRSVLMEKLRQQMREYKGILKCRICHDRQKEVVIAKCYHLFCTQCVERTIESRQRKCPTCSVSFGQNDVKPIYI
ncbi:E3 ubiquitin-protein ligase BRE1-like 1 [Platanthera zijinensis]|uniref:E3 ubiquitin protein ligase n=1 Tax=Platanthera zijinensis TaxID=2320716 RepID=A0AAP0G6W1_9ASPA